MRNGAMKGWRRGFAAAALVAAAGLRASPPAQAEGVDPQLSSRLQRIESAFRGGDAGALRPCFASSGKVRVDLKDLTDGPCLLYTSPSPRDRQKSRMPSSA